MAKTVTDFDELDIELASEHQRQIETLEDEPPSRVLLPPLAPKKPPTIRINLQNPNFFKKDTTVVTRTIEPERREVIIEETPVRNIEKTQSVRKIIQQASKSESSAFASHLGKISKKNLKSEEIQVEIRRLFAQTLTSEDQKQEAVFYPLKSYGFRIVCRACNISCTSELNLIEHANGKRHLANIVELQARRKMTDQGNFTLAPGEPVPPGFEDEIKRVPKCQEKLDAFKDSPVIGLEYLVELMADDDENSRMVCFLCDKNGVNLLPTNRTNIISHIIGTSHRIAYLKKHFPAAHEAIQNVKNDRERKMDSGRLARLVAANIEEEYGRLKPTVVERSVYEMRKDIIREQIEKDKHFNETFEKTFVDIVTPPKSNALSQKSDTNKLEERDELQGRFKRDINFSKEKSGSASFRLENEPGCSQEKIKRQNSNENSSPDTNDDRAKKKKQRLDNPLRDTTPVSVSSGTLSLSSDSDSKSRSSGHRSYGRHRSPIHSRSPGRNRSPDRYFRRSIVSRYSRGRYYNEYRRHRSRSPSFRRSSSRSPRRFARSPVGSKKQRNKSRSKSPIRSVRRSNDTPSPHVTIINSPERLSRSSSPSLSREESQASVSRKAPWMPSARGGHRSGAGRVSRTDKSLSPEPLTKRDKWCKFREKADALELKMEELRQLHKKNPEKHPLYKEEWKKFWNRRYQELQAEGKDAASHNFKPEWIDFWNKKVEEMHVNELKLRKETLKKKLELSDEDEPPQKQWSYIRTVHAPPDDTTYGYAGRDPSYQVPSYQGVREPVYQDYKQPRGSVSDVKDTWKALTGGDIRAEPRCRSPSWAPPNRYMRGPPEERSYPSYQSSHATANRIISVLRTLTALENQLGSFGPKINSLLAEALSMEKTEYASSQDLIRVMENVLLLESIKEKFKGMLMAGLVDRGNVNATRVAIADITELLNRAPPPIKKEPVQQSKPATVTSASVAVPGVGDMDRAAIALQLTEALVAQGKTDVSEAELQELIDAVIGMTKQQDKPVEPLKREPKKDEKSTLLNALEHMDKKESDTTTTAAGEQSDALRVIQAAYKRSPPPVQKKREDKRPVLSNVAEVGDLCEADLKSCLRIYQHLSSNEQRSLIMYLKLLEEKDPRRVENLRKYVNLGSGSVHDDSDDETRNRTPYETRASSPFSSRKGGANPSVILQDSDDDYSFEDVCKAAMRNINTQQNEKETDKNKRMGELNKLKALTKSADNSAIKQAIQATTDTMIANLLETASSSTRTRNVQKNASEPVQFTNRAQETQSQIPTQLSQRTFRNNQFPQNIKTINESARRFEAVSQSNLPSSSYTETYGMQQNPNSNPYMGYTENPQYSQGGQYQSQQPPNINKTHYQYSQSSVSYGHLQQQQQQEASYHPAQYSATYEKRHQQIGNQKSAPAAATPSTRQSTPSKRVLGPTGDVELNKIEEVPSISVTPKAAVTKSPRVTSKDYETGSDEDEWILKSKKVTKIRQTDTSTSKKKPLETTTKSKPFELLGLKPSAQQDDSHLVHPRLSFHSDFARNLGEQRSGLRLLSNNGHPSGTSGTSQTLHQRSEMPLSRSASVPQQEDHQPAWNSSHISKALLAVLVVFFAYLAYCYLGMRSSSDISPQIASFESNPENRFPLCKDGYIPGVTCVVPKDARTAMAALKIIVPQLTTEAIHAICNPSASVHDPSNEEASRGALSFKQLEEILQFQGDPDSENTVANMRILARLNPHWGIEVLQNGMTIADPSLPMLCYLRTRLIAIFSFLLIIVPVVGAMVAVGWMVYVFQRTRYRKEQQIRALVCRIQDMLEAQAETGNEPCLPHSTLRDELIPQQDRKRLEVVWQKAVDLVISQDSRIRLEVRRVAGEEVPFLVWLPGTPSKSTRSVTRSSMMASTTSFKQMTRSPPQALYPSLVDCPENGEPIASQSMTNFNTKDATDSPASRRQRVWQGQAFETQEGSVNSLPYSPTPCLKIRKMFDPDVYLRGGEDEGAWLDRIRNAILEKCGESVNVLHIAVDKNSTEGCVYVKCATPMDAGRAYRALHGAWYDGNLVTVKYLHLKRYHERFPDAAEVCIPLLPSNSRKLSLQGYWAQQVQLNTLERT